MNYKSLILLICILVFCSGCSVEYKLNIDKYFNLEENVEINFNNDEIEQLQKFNSYVPIDKDIDSLEALETKQDDIKYYNQIKNNKQLKFNYIFKQEEYIDSTFVSNAYEYISITKVDDELFLSTSKEFKLFEIYPNLEEIKVILTSNYKLLKTNADEVARHTYIWYINKNNAYGKNIYLKLATNKEDLNFWERLKNGEYTNIFTISLLLFVIGIIIYGYLKRKSIKRDEI